MREWVTRSITAIGVGWVIGTVFLLFPSWCFTVLLLGILGIILSVEWPVLVARSRLRWFTLFYPVLPFFLLMLLNIQGYFCLLALLLTVVPAFDIGGYIVGKAIGKTKLWPAVSPGKTWEGFVGGVLAVVITLYLLALFSDVMHPWHLFVLAACVIGVLATAGDLFESWIKRRAGVKDSGQLLPGHGGFLDRFDAILFVVVFFFIFRDAITVLLK